MDITPILQRSSLAVMATCALPLSVAAVAQDPQQAAQRALLQRQQQHDEQVLRLQQWQQRLQTPFNDSRRSMALDQIHLQQRQHQDAIHSRQENQMRVEQGAGTPPGGSGATDLPRLARERDIVADQARRERANAERSGRDP
ncbi:MAG: hypothetical protein ACKVQU_12425 [Burkholderiales bacterium]